jgi:hypothetical protein
MAGEGGASRRDDFVEGFEGGDVLVDDRFVDRRPQRFGRGRLRGVGGLEDEPIAVRHGEAGFAAPTGVVERQNDAPRAPGAATQIAHRRRPERVAALDKLLDPTLAKRGHPRRLAGRMTFRQ